jgi:hypothetical protein
MDVRTVLAVALVAACGCAGHAPLTPSVPAGASNGLTSSSMVYTTYSTDRNAGPVSLRFDWDDGSMSNWTPDTFGYGITLEDSHRWQIAGIYHVRSQARDARERLSLWSDSFQVTITSPGDEPPFTPDPPLGPDSGLVDSTYAFRSSTTDDDNDSLQYQFTWGNGDTSLWFAPIPAGETLTVHYGWSAPGAYDVQVRAKDAQGFGATSGWSLPHLTVIH